MNIPFFKPIMLAGLVLLLGATAMAAFFPYPYHVVTLDNGFTTIMIPMKGSGLVAYYSVVRTGSRDEWEPGHTGFAHFFEHMMFRGTKKYPGPVYDRIMTELGADSNAYTTDDLTCFTITCSTDDLERIMELESDRFENLSYAEADFKTEAGAVYGEFLKSKSSPFFLLEEKLMDTAFDKHTYKHTTMGFEKDIEAMPTMYQYSRSFFKRYYRPGNVVLLLVGDFDPATVKPMLQKYYGDWKTGYVPPKITPEPPQTAPRSAEVTYPGRTLPMIAMAYKSPAFTTETKDWLSCDILGDLAFGPNSDIYKDLVLNRQVAQNLMAMFSQNRDPNLNTVLAMVKSDTDLDTVRQAVTDTLRKFQDTPVDSSLLDRQKQRMKYGYLMRLSTPSAVAGSLARLVAITGGIKSVDEMYALLDTITPADIQAAARKYFTPEQRTIVVLKGEKQ